MTQKPTNQHTAAPSVFYSQRLLIYSHFISFPFIASVFIFIKPKPRSCLSVHLHCYSFHFESFIKQTADIKVSSGAEEVVWDFISGDDKKQNKEKHKRRKLKKVLVFFRRLYGFYGK